MEKSLGNLQKTWASVWGMKGPSLEGLFMRLLVISLDYFIYLNKKFEGALFMFTFIKTKTPINEKIHIASRYPNCGTDRRSLYYGHNLYYKSRPNDLF